MQRFFLSQFWNDLFILSAIIAFFFPGFLINSQNWSQWVLIQVFLFSIQGLIFGRRTSRTLFSKPTIYQLFQSFGLLALLVLVSFFVSGILSFYGVEAKPLKNLDSWDFWAWSIFLLSPLREELFFRGLLLETLREKSAPKWLGIALQALVFSLAHGLSIANLTPLISGVLLGFWAWKNPGQTPLLTAIHLLHNLIILFFTYFQRIV